VRRGALRRERGRVERRGSRASGWRQAGHQRQLHRPRDRRGHGQHGQPAEHRLGSARWSTQEPLLEASGRGSLFVVTQLRISIRASHIIVNQKKLFVGVPCYGGMLSCLTAHGLLELYVSLHASGVASQTPYLVANESLVTRARNRIVAEFLKSDCSHLFF